MNKKIYIAGSGGLGKEMKAFLRRNDAYDFSGFFDDHDTSSEVLGSIDDANSERFKSGNFIIAVGNSQIRKAIRSRLKSDDSAFPTLVHESAIIMDPSSITIGQGSVISAGSILTTDIEIGNYCFVNLNCTIGHDSTLESFVSIMPSVNIGGKVHVEEGAFLGTNATVLPGVRIGKDAIVGAGALVNQDVPSGATVKGVPAR